MKSITEKSNNQNQILAIELLKVAISDIVASEILYENRLFSQSYFYFQQATEKGTKALILFLEMGSAKDTFNVRHNIFKLHKSNILKTKEVNYKALELINALPFFETSGLLETKRVNINIENSEQSIHFFNNMKDLDLINITAKVILSFLEEIEGLELNGLRMPNDLEKRFDSFFMPFINKMESDDSKAAQYMAIEMRKEFASKEFRDLFREHSTDVIKILLHTLYAYGVLYFCGYLTIQHSSISRYPHTEDPKKNPLNIYNKRLPVVKYQPLFLKHLKKALIIVDKYFKNTS